MNRLLSSQANFTFIKYLQALTLVGLPTDNPELDPLAVLHLNNRLYMK